MSKAVLIMNMPETCAACDIVLKIPHGGTYESYCPRLKRTVNPFDRPAKCPLIPAIGYVEPVGNMISWEDDSDELDRNKARRVTQESDDGYFICPSCLRAVDAYANFCSNCGQRLDWEDEE